jgi:hypothetical protein
MYGLFIDDVKGTCLPITDSMCVKYKKKLLLFWAWKAELLQLVSEPLDKVQWVYEMQRMHEVTQIKIVVLISVIWW